MCRPGWTYDVREPDAPDAAPAPEAPSLASPPVVAASRGFSGEGGGIPHGTAA